jgi:methionyl-tRNA formyltransferase
VSLKGEAEQAEFTALNLDAAIVVAYGLLLPKAILDAPRLGCFNLHGSLLPRWRGAAPIHRAIEAGDQETGVTIMQMDAGLDTGDMCLIERLPIGPTDTTASLHDQLAELGGRLIVEALEMSACGGLPRTPQPAEGVTYAHKIEKAESWIDWGLPAATIDRRVRALTPFPGAAGLWQGETIKFWEGRPEARGAAAAAGTVLAADAAGVVVACGEGAMRFTQLQRAGGKRLAAGDFLHGFALPVGAQLEAAP